MPDTQIYGLDIETDTSRASIDPKVTPIVAVALSGPNFDEVFRGPEPELLSALDVRLAALAPGVIATWNGAVFDLPFIADRAAHHDVPLGLCLVADPTGRGATQLLPGHGCSYRARWHHHRHLDTLRVLGPTGTVRRSPLRSLIRSLGRTGSGATGVQHDLAHEARHAHAPSDARLARVLAGRHWAGAVRSVDLLPPAVTPAVTSRPNDETVAVPRPAHHPAVAGI